MSFVSAADAVARATEGLFNNWSALQLTLENHDPSRTGPIARALFERTVAMATTSSKRHDRDDFTQLFYSAFDDMNTDVEDGSPEQVAAKLVAIRDAAARGDFAPAAEAFRRSGSTAAYRTRSVTAAERQDASPSGAASMQTGGASAPHPPPREAPKVDDDGFTSVVRKARR